jgi:hypothetical protein
MWPMPFGIMLTQVDLSHRFFDIQDLARLLMPHGTVIGKLTFSINQNDRALSPHSSISNLND